MNIVTSIRKKPIVVGLFAVVGIVIVLFICVRPHSTSTPTSKPTFIGRSSELKQTQIVATLDEKITPGKNAIFCASYQAAWKALQNDLIGEPVKLAETVTLASQLNGSTDLRSDVPSRCLYTAAGWNNEGIVDKIRTDMQRQFPGKQPPVFPGIARNSFVTYAYLQTYVKFHIPYFQNRQPIIFTDSAGRKTGVSAFGIREEDEHAYFKLRGQSKVLFRNISPRDNNTFAIDLDKKSSPIQIIVAQIPRERTLAFAVEYVERVTAEAEKMDPSYAYIFLRSIGPNDVLLVPDLHWQISHRFTELEGKTFLNDSKVRGQRLDVAQQDISFCLDRSGAELRSEAKSYVQPIPTYFIIDRPFLIYMKKRGANTPYFAMWVDNAELLNKEANRPIP